VHRGQDARTLGDARIDGVAQAHIDEVVRANIAHGGEPRLQSPSRVHGGVHGLLGGKAHQAVVDEVVIVLLELEREMRVRVDEAGENRRITQIDDPRARGGCGGSDRHDAIAAHHDGSAVLECGAGGVEQVSRFQNDGLRRLGTLR